MGIYGFPLVALHKAGARLTHQDVLQFCLSADINLEAHSHLYHLTLNSSWTCTFEGLISPVLGRQVTRGVMYTRQEAEGKRLRNPFDTITEGIGINRETANFKQATIDSAFQGTDQEAVEMVRSCSLP